jgi:pyridoxal phosphate enzyme (YggS family)
MSLIASNLQAVNTRILAALRDAFSGAGRAVMLVAVSKTRPPEVIREAHAAGQHAFGENYVQEAIAKIAALADLDIEWHFIGPIQGNKAKLIAQHFSWAHGVDRSKIAEALSRHRPAGHPDLNICIQVNVSGEASKGGVRPDEALNLARQVAALPNLRLRGLMAIIENTTEPLAQHAQFRMLRELAGRITDAGIPLDTLSMGMTQDFEIAIEEGSNMVRIGSAIFGKRGYKAESIKS